MWVVEHQSQRYSGKRSCLSTRWCPGPIETFVSFCLYSPPALRLQAPSNYHQVCVGNHGFSASTPLSYAYKAPRRSPLCWSIFSLASSSRVLLRFSFAIYPFPRMDKRPDFDGFHMLLTDRLQLSPR